MASKVIIVDLWWNESVENQAFCRCYRIGQTRPVDIRRYVIKNTIDDRVLQMQEKKKAQIDGALEGRSPRILSVEDLVHLFGPPDVDENGIVQGDPEEEPFIFVEDEEQPKPHEVPVRPVDWKSVKSYRG
jgi:hypothetical protein